MITANGIFIIFYILKAVECGNTGIASFPQLQEQLQTLDLFFESNGHTEPVRLRSSFQLVSFKVTWKIHNLPVMMGADACSLSHLGECFQCFQVRATNPNTISEVNPQCIEGSSLSMSSVKLPDCAKLIGKDGIIGRSVVLTLEQNRKTQIYCSTIKLKDNNNPFTSTIAWLQTPYAGFVTFTKQDQMQSYVIVNLTCVDRWVNEKDDIKWDIRDSNDSDAELFSNERDIDTNSEQYNTACSANAHKSCVEGDLWRKHGKLKLYNDQVNLHMFIDFNLDTTVLRGKYIKLYKITNGTKFSVISYTKIEELYPIKVEVPFIEGSVLSMLQYGPWSPVQHWYSIPNLNNGIDSWKITIHQGPTIQIFSGELWKCELMWSKKSYVPQFETSRNKRYLNQTYTLYGRDSIMYHGVSVKREFTKELCSTITYRQGEEKIAYSKLEHIIQLPIGQQAIVLIIEHTILRQTTFLIATVCQEFTDATPLFLTLNEHEECSSDDIYNPYNVCPAQCSPTYCSSACSSGCCTMCSDDSSSLCPLGDLRHRLGHFIQVQTNIRNEEVVFTVMNDMDLPVDQMIGKFLGFRIIQNSGTELVRCGQIHPLDKTEIMIDLTGGNVTISQQSTWQPLMISWKGVTNLSLTFWKVRKFSQSVCKFTPDQKNARRPTELRYSESELQYSPRSLPGQGNQEKRPSLYGPHSVWGTRLTISYRRADGQDESTNQNIASTGSNNKTYSLQCTYRSNNNISLLQFDFYQRQNHLTEETYISVEVLHRSFCYNPNTTPSKKIIKWYLIDKEYASTIEIGQEFRPSDYDDVRFFIRNMNECQRAVPYNHMGDFSGIFGDIELDAPGKIYRHAALPLLLGNDTHLTDIGCIRNLTRAEGHFLVLADTTNSVIAVMELKQAPQMERGDDNGIYDLTKSPNGSFDIKVILICVFMALAIMTTTCIVAYYYMKRNRAENSATYHPVQPNGTPSTEQCTGGMDPKLVVNTETNRLVYLIEPTQGLSTKAKQKDYLTGEVATFHYAVYRDPTDEELQIQKVVQTMGSSGSHSTNGGSTLNRSRGTIAEENVYVMPVSPPAQRVMVQLHNVNGFSHNSIEYSSSSSSSI